MPLGHGSRPWAPAWSARDSTLDPVAHLDRGRGGPWPAWLRGRSAGPRGALRVFRESRRQAHAPAPPGVWVQRPGLRPQGLPGTRLLPAVPRHTARLVRVGAVRRAADTPNFWGRGFCETGHTGPFIGFQWMGVTGPPCVVWGVLRTANQGPAVPADRAWLGCRAFVSCRRCEGSAANRTCRHALGAGRYPKGRWARIRVRPTSHPPDAWPKRPGAGLHPPRDAPDPPGCPATTEVGAVSSPASGEFRHPRSSTLAPEADHHR